MFRDLSTQFYIKKHLRVQILLNNYKLKKKHHQDKSNLTKKQKKENKKFYTYR